MELTPSIRQSIDQYPSTIRWRLRELVELKPDAWSQTVDTNPGLAALSAIPDLLVEGHECLADALHRTAELKPRVFLQWLGFGNQELRSLQRVLSRVEPRYATQELFEHLREAWRNPSVRKMIQHGLPETASPEFLSLFRLQVQGRLRVSQGFLQSVAPRTLGCRHDDREATTQMMIRRFEALVVAEDFPAATPLSWPSWEAFQSFVETVHQLGTLELSSKTLSNFEVFASRQERVRVLRTVEAAGMWGRRRSHCLEKGQLEEYWIEVVEGSGVLLAIDSGSEGLGQGQGTFFLLGNSLEATWTLEEFETSGDRDEVLAAFEDFVQSIEGQEVELPWDIEEDEDSWDGVDRSYDELFEEHPELFDEQPELFDEFQEPVQLELPFPRTWWDRNEIPF